MSMNGQFRRVSTRAATLVVERPHLAPALLAFAARGDDDESDPLHGVPLHFRGLLEELPEEQVAAAAEQFRAIAAQLGSAMEELYAKEMEELRGAGISPDDVAPVLDIRKNWHGLHYLLTGSEAGGEGPLARAVLGGREIGDDMGYGPVRLLDAAEAAAAAEALDAVRVEDLTGRFDPEAMEIAGIYPSGWGDPDYDALDDLLTAFELVRGYYLDAQAAGQAMLLAIT
ncbi:MAG TPA: YfbM family protein [Longimicrobium sp.]|nr:YfbM family protein [Longimicrobium sp.]